MHNEALIAGGTANVANDPDSFCLIAMRDEFGGSCRVVALGKGRAILMDYHGAVVLVLATPGLRAGLCGSRGAFNQLPLDCLHQACHY